MKPTDINDLLVVDMSNNDLNWAELTGEYRLMKVSNGDKVLQRAIRHNSSKSSKIVWETVDEVTEAEFAEESLTL